MLSSSGSAEGGSPLPGCGVSPQTLFFFSFARRRRRRGKVGRKLGTPQAPAGRPLHPFSQRTGMPCSECSPAGRSNTPLYIMKRTPQRTTFVHQKKKEALFMQTMVQVSLDLRSIPEALDLAHIAVEAGVDWLEAGT